MSDACWVLPNGECVGGTMMGREPCVHDAKPASAGAWSDEECRRLWEERPICNRLHDAFEHGLITICVHDRNALIRAAAERAAREEREACVALLEAASLGIAASGTPAFPLAAGMLQQLKNAILARGKP